MNSIWKPLKPDEVLSLLSGSNFLWAFAGGYAIEMYLQESFREHDDIDIIVSRSDQFKLRDLLSGWDLKLCDPPGCHREWKPDEYLDSVNDVWCRESSDLAWSLQVMFVDVLDGKIKYRRNESVDQDLSSAILETSEGHKYLSPEFQLLYKSKNIRAKDRIDFEKCAARLSQDQVAWLTTNMLSCYPYGHDWLEALASISSKNGIQN